MHRSGWLFGCTLVTPEMKIEVRVCGEAMGFGPNCEAASLQSHRSRDGSCLENKPGCTQVNGAGAKDPGDCIQMM